MACPASTVVRGCDFTQLLVDQMPHYDDLILEDVTPVSSWVGNMKTSVWENFTGTEHTIDRFTDVYPNTLVGWERVQVANCLGNPCDLTRNEIGFGAKRLTYFLERMGMKTKLLCYEQEMHITHAQEHLSQIITKVLRPASLNMNSMFMRKRAALFAGKKWIANRNIQDFTFVFSTSGTDGEIFVDCSVSPTNVFKLTPQMLQRRFHPLMNKGYGGANPFKETAPWIEAVLDMDAVWELDHLGGQQGVGGVPSVNGNWRFEQWDATSKYWRYGFSGSIGNYMVRADMSNIRMNFVRDLGAASAPNRFRYQIILPYINGITGGAGGAPGLGRDENPAFQLAQFRWGFIWHKDAMEVRVSDSRSINEQMPYMHRDFAGGWRFVMDNLGADANGVAIANFDRNKGMFVSDFKQGIRPLNTEWAELIMYKAEPQCVIEINTCASDPGYPVQSYKMANDECGVSPISIVFTPILATHNDGTAQTFELLANSIVCNGEPINHAAITGSTTIAGLIDQLNRFAPSLGLWGGGGSTITLSGTDCDNVNLNWQETI